MKATFFSEYRIGINILYYPSPLRVPEFAATFILNYLINYISNKEKTMNICKPGLMDE